MTDLEQRLREAMTRYDTDAPTVAEFLAHHPSRARRVPRATVWAPVAAVVVTALVVTGIVLLGRHPLVQDHALPQQVVHGGPASSGIACPVKTPAVVDEIGSVPTTSDRTPAHALSPRTAPDSVTVCSYGERLQGSRVLTTNMPGIANYLAAIAEGIAHGCDQYRATTDSQYYLIALRYADWTDWIAAPGDHCAGSSNGRFVSMQNLRADAQQAYRYGRWVTDPAVTRDCSDVPAPGDSTTLPANAASVIICRSRPTDPTAAYRYPAAVASALVDAYNAAVAKRRGASTCPEIMNPDPVSYTAVFRYPGRGAVTLALPPECVQGPGGITITGSPAENLAGEVERTISQS